MLDKLHPSYWALWAVVVSPAPLEKVEICQEDLEVELGPLAELKKGEPP